MSFARHQEYGLDLGSETPVHQSHLKLVFVIRNGANAAQNNARAAVGRIVDQEAVKGCDLDVGKAADYFIEHLDAFFDREKGLFFLVAQDRHQQLIEQGGAALDQIEMPIGDRVEGTGINSDDTGRFGSQAAWDLKERRE